MKRILFAEDNELLLELYGAMLDSERDHWQTYLAPNGEAALRLLRQAPFDVVISDMQMPGMNGIELLTEARKLHPQSARIIISGATDQAEAADSLNCTHLFIPKPVDAKLLRDTLTRIGKLDAYLKDAKLRELVGKMGSLPSFPALYLEILREIEAPNCSIENVADLVSKDPAIAAKILRVANSAAVGLGERVTNLTDAVQQLGLTTVRSLVLSAQVYGNFAPGRLKNFSADQLWNHLMKCADLARTIMRRDRAEVTDAEDAFTAGMLHDMGKLMLADGMPSEFAQSMELAARENLSQVEAERAVMGADHAGVAAYLFGLWGLPASIVEAVAFHHSPEQSDLKQPTALTAVHVASALLSEPGSATLNHDYLTEIGVADRLDDWQDTASELQMETATGR